MPSELTTTAYPDEVKYVTADIVKVTEASDGALLVVGKPASSQGNDIDGQIADPTWLRSALPEWMQWANVREMHQPSAVGVGESLDWDANNEPVLTARVIDKAAKEKVREKVYNGFSIGVKNPVVVPDMNAPGGRIVGGYIIEVSLVDRPAHSLTRFTLAKSANPTTWLDVQSGVVFDLAEATTMAADLIKGVDEGDAGSGGDIKPSGRPFADLTGLTYNGHAVKVLEQEENRCVCEIDGKRYAARLKHRPDGSYVMDGEPVEIADQAAPDTENKGVEGDMDKLVLPDSYLMAEATLYKRDFSTAERKKATKEGHALPNGSYPIYTCEDVSNARGLYRSGHGDVAAARRHTESWAKKLGCGDGKEDGKMADTDTATKAAAPDAQAILDAALAERVWCEEEQLLVKMTVVDTQDLGPAGAVAFGHDESGHELRKFVPPAGGDATGRGGGEADDGDADDVLATKAAGPHSDGDDCKDDDDDHNAWMDAQKKGAGTGDPAAGKDTEDVQAAAKGKNEGADGLIKAVAADPNAFLADLVKSAVTGLLADAGIDLDAVGSKLQEARIEKFGAALDELKSLAAEVAKDAAGNAGGPHNVQAPGEGGAAVRTQFVSVMNLVNQLAGQLAKGDGDFGAGRTTQPDSFEHGVADAISTGRWDLTRSVDPDLTKSPVPSPIDVAKVASQAAAGTVNAVLPELAKSVAAQMTEAFKPLMQRLEEVEHRAAPARNPVLVEAERRHAMNPDASKAAEADGLLRQQLQESLGKLTDQERENALAALLSAARR